MVEEHSGRRRFVGGSEKRQRKNYQRQCAASHQRMKKEIHFSYGETMAAEKEMKYGNKEDETDD